MDRNLTLFSGTNRLVGITLLVMLCVTGLIAWELEKSNRQAIEAAVSTAAEELADTVVNRVRLYQYGLRGARGVILSAGEHDVSREIFKRYSLTRDLDVEFRGARGFGFIRRVPQAEVEVFLSRARADDAPNFAVRELSPNTGERYVIQYIEPYIRNAAAVGLDIASETNRREAAWSAITSGEVRLTRPITLVQATGHPLQSFLILLPIYRGGVTPESLEEREAKAFGWSYAPLLMDEVLADLNLNNIYLDLHDISIATEPAAFYTNSERTPHSQRFFEQRLQREVFGRHWLLEVGVNNEFITGLNQTSPHVVLSLGAILSVLTAMLVGVVSVSGHRRREMIAGQARLATIVESSAEAIIGQALSGEVVSWNKGAEQIFGYTAEEVVGHKLNELIVPEGRDAESEDILQHATHGESVTNFDTQRLHRNGQLLDVSISAAPILDDHGVVVAISKTVRDISGQKSAERRIRELNANLELQVVQRTAELMATRDQLLMAAEISELGIWSWTIADNSLQWNDCMYELYDQPLSLKDNGLDYSHWRERLHPDDVAMAEASLMAAVEGRGHYDVTFRIIKTNGDIRYVQAGAQIERDSSGAAIKVTGINRDVTAQRELESYLRQAKERSDAASEAKSTFLANMSHEIRTPMNAVLGMLQLMLQTELNTRQQDYISKAQTAAKSLLHLLNDILDYSKIEAGKLQFDLHPFDLEALMHDLAIVLCGNQDRSEVELIFDFSPNLPSQLIGDGLRLQQVLTNLAGNALKFTEQGKVLVSITELERTKSTILLRFSVADTGIGIATEHLERVFEGFSQAEASTTRRFGGTGLGLVICKRLVAMMGGDLQVSSTPGEGSCFWFDVGLEIANPKPLKMTCPMHDMPLRLLLVDKHIELCECLLNMIGTLGWQVDKAHSAHHAVEQLRYVQQQEKNYDALLLGSSLPGLGGLSAVQVIRQSSDHDDLPIILMLAANESNMLNSIQSDATAHTAGLLLKPVTPYELAKVVAHVVNQTAAEPVQKIMTVSEQRLQDLSLLVVEDNALNRQVIAELLRNEGADVHLAEGGLEGVSKVLDQEHDFDLVLMDIQMPDIDGFEATRRIRADERFHDLPIVAITANASATDRALCLEAGMNEHVTKPIDLDEVVAAVLKFTNRQIIESVQEITVDHVDPVVDDKVIEDLPSIMKRFSNNFDLYAQMLDSFGEGEGKLLDELAVHVRDHNIKGAAAIVHSIKGSAGTMGAKRLYEDAADLEKKLKSGDNQLAISLLNEKMLSDFRSLLFISVERLRSALMEVKPAELAPEMTVTSLSAEQWKALLEETLSLLKSNNLRVLEVVKGLPESLPNGDIDHPKQFKNYIENLDFVAAIKQARMMLEAL